MWQMSITAEIVDDFASKELLCRLVAEECNTIPQAPGTLYPPVPRGLLKEVLFSRRSELLHWLWQNPDMGSATDSKRPGRIFYDVRRYCFTVQRRPLDWEWPKLEERQHVLAYFG